RGLGQTRAKLRADAGRFTRDQREPERGQSAAVGVAAGIDRHIVIAGRGTGTEVDECLAAHFADEAVPLVFQLAPADRFAHLVTLGLVADVTLAGAGTLDDMPAGLGAERCREA